MIGLNKAKTHTNWRAMFSLERRNMEISEELPSTKRWYKTFFFSFFLFIYFSLGGSEIIKFFLSLLPWCFFLFLPAWRFPRTSPLLYLFVNQFRHIFNAIQFFISSCSMGFFFLFLVPSKPEYISWISCLSLSRVLNFQFYINWLGRLYIYIYIY